MTDYLPLPVTKELNNSELAYYRELINGLNNTIGVTVDWLATPEAKELYRKRQDEINAFFEDSGIEADWDTLITSNASNSEEYVNRFYQLGAAIGYSDINRKLSYTKADKEALFHLKKYNFDLVKDVNTELVKGIKKTITEAVAEGNGAEVTSRRLRELPLQPVGNISLETRCNMIARTEHARAVCTGTLQAYSNYDVSMVNVITTGDALVCDDCATAEKNNPHTLLEAQDLLPMHPNCRCTFAPVIGDTSIPPSQPISNPNVVNLIS